MPKYFAFTLACLVGLCTYAYPADTALETKPRPSGNPYIYPLKETVKRTAELGLQDAKKGKFSTIRLLCFPSRVTEALSYVKPYATDPDPNVRQAVAIIATYAASNEGAATLAVLIGSKGDSGLEAAYGLFNVYSPNEIRQWGGSSLKKNLIQHLRHHMVISEALFLLSTFGEEAEVQQFLKSYRHLHEDDTTMITQGESPVVPAAFAVDVVLSEIADTSSVKNLKVDWSVAQVEKAIYPLYALKFINNKFFLRDLHGLLDNNNVVRSINLWERGRIEIRVKDIAFNAFADKIGLIPSSNLYPHSQVEGRKIDELKLLLRKPVE